MMTLANFLVGIVGFLAARIIVSLGLTLVVVTGAVAALGQLRTMVISAAQGLPSDVLLLAGLMGAWDSLGIVFGALTFAVSWGTTANFVSLAKA